MAEFISDKKLRDIKNNAIRAIESLEHYLRVDIEPTSIIEFSKQDVRDLLRIYARLRTYVQFINSEYNNLFFNLKVDKFLEKIESFIDDKDD